MIDLSVTLDKTSLEAGVYEDLICLETNAGQFEVPVKFNKRIRWDIITKFTIIFAFGTGISLWLIRSLIKRYVKVDNFWFSLYKNSNFKRVHFLENCTQSQIITIQEIKKTFAVFASLLIMIMIVLLGKFLPEYRNIRTFISCFIWVLLILPMLFLIDLTAYSFIWFSIVEAPWRWLLLGSLVGGFVGITIAFNIISQRSYVFRVSVIAILMATVLVITGYLTTKSKWDTCNFQPNKNTEYQIQVNHHD